MQIGADIVEVSPPYDHAEITAYAASDLVFEVSAVARLTGHVLTGRRLRISLLLGTR